MVGKGDVPAGAEATDVGAVFVFDAEEGPDGAAADFGERDEEGEAGAVLKVSAVDGVKDPVEAEDGVQDHGGVVNPRPLVAEYVSQEGISGVWVAETWRKVNWCGRRGGDDGFKAWEGTYSSPWRGPRSLEFR